MCESKKYCKLYIVVFHPIFTSGWFMQSNLRLRPPLVSNHLSSATSFPKYQKFFDQITALGTSGKQPPFVGDRDQFKS